MLAILRFPVVAFGFVVDRLRRLPGARTLGRHASLIAVGLLLAALVAFIVWGIERAPQRISLAELAAGALSPMQSWIIVSGQLSGPEPSHTSDFRYRLTDPAAPNATMIVTSSSELTLGWTTLSGTYVGTREGVPPGFRWIGQMQADRVLAQEQPPPWIALILAAAGLLVGVGGRFSYPTFFSETPDRSAPSAATLAVNVSGGTASREQLVPGTLRLQPGEPVILRLQGADEQRLRLHSAYTSVEVGELRGLSRSEPAIRVRQPTGDLDITFASRGDRDAAFAALAADARTRV